MLSGPPSTTPSSGTDAATMAASPTPTPRPTLAPSGFTSVSWTVAPLGDGSGRVLDVTAAGDRIVAVGQGEGAPVAWVSDDGGATWVAEDLPTGEAPAEGATATASRIVGIGERLAVTGIWTFGTASSPILWRSDDGGRTWFLTAEGVFSLIPDSLSVGPAGYLASAADAATGVHGLFSSPDGVGWSQVAAIGLSGEAGASLVLAAGPAGFLAAGSSAHEIGLSPAAWISADGVRWSIGMDDPQVLGGTTLASGSPVGYATAGQAFTDAHSATTPDRGLAMLWRSPDGVSWEATQVAGVGTRPVALAMDEAGTLVAVATVGADAATALFVANGSGAPVRTELSLNPTLLTAAGGRFVAIGGCGPAADCLGTLVAIGVPTR